MARILLLYGTTDGHTGKVARAVGDTLRTLNHEVDVIDARTGWPSATNYDAVVVAASVHAGGYQRAVHRWVRAHAETLNTRPTAFVSVCLGILQRDPKVDADLKAILTRFLAATRWQPRTVKAVAGALPYTRYNPFTRWIMKRIVSKAGGDTDTSRDYEYTDWNDLRAFAEGFGRSLEGTADADAAVTTTSARAA